MMNFEFWITVWVVGFFLSFWIFPGFRKNFYYWPPEFVEIIKKCPGPKSVPIFGNLYHFYGTNVEIFNTLRRFAKTYTPRYHTWGFSLSAINLMTPQDIEALVGNPKQLGKNHPYMLMMPWLGTGLLVSRGNKWKSRRKMLTPAFHFNILKEFVKIFEDNGIRAVELFSDECEKESTDVIPFVTDYALHTICETTMGYKMDPTTETTRSYKDALIKYVDVIIYRYLRPWLFSNLIFNMTYTSFTARRLLKKLHAFTGNVIEERLVNWDSNFVQEKQSSTGKKKMAMLNLMIESMKDGGNIDIHALQEEVDTFMFEGHDTVTMGLTFTLLLLANNRKIQDRIVDEVRRIQGDSEGSTTYEDLQSMNYLEMCIKEALRLYPSVPFIGRQLDEDLVLNDMTIPKGFHCNIHIYDLHHDPKHWPDPDKFDPERFSPENCVGRHPYAYIPFSAGSRNCIGQRFAILEMKSFLSKVLLKFILEPVDTPETVVLLPDLVLRCEGSIKVKFRKRV